MRYLIVFTFLMLFQFVVAQESTELNDCQNKLKQAEKAYEQGRIELIKGLLSDCLDKFERVDKEKAYKLMTNAYLYDNEELKAEESMLKMLRINPEYVLDEKRDAPEFKALLSKYQRAPVLIFGAEAGGNLNMIRIENDYKLDDATIKDWEYINKYSFQINAPIEIPLKTKYVSVRTGLGFVGAKFQYIDNVMDFGKIDYIESNYQVVIPVGVRVNFLKNKFVPYIDFGYKGSMSLSSSALIVRKDELPTLDQREVSGPNIKMNNQRSTFNHQVYGELGFKWRVLGKHYLTFNVVYNYGLNLFNNPERRYENTELIYDYLYLDDDFKWSSIQANIGYVIPFFNPKLKKEYRRNK